jgi:hypothetical protein
VLQCDHLGGQVSDLPLNLSDQRQSVVDSFFDHQNPALSKAGQLGNLIQSFSARLPPRHEHQYGCKERDLDN